MKSAKQSKDIQETEVRSFKDAGYRSAKSGDENKIIARFVLDHCPTFPKDLSKDIKTELFAGFQLRAHENWGSKFYKLADGVFIPLEGEPSKDDKGILDFNVNFAMSFSQQEFGKLRSNDPAKHAIIKEWRDRFSNYASNCMATLALSVKQLTAIKKTRAENAGFVEAMTAVFDSYEKRVKTAETRGDSEADPLKYRMARDAFWKAYKA